MRRSTSRILRAAAVFAVVAAPIASAGAAGASFPIPVDPILPGPLPVLYFCNGELATIVGTSDADMIEGTDGHDVIVALGGNDWIYDRAGDDTVCAGLGHDVIFGAEDNDWIDGQGGVDTIDFRLAPVPVTIDLRLQRTDATGSHDTVLHVESVQGSNYDDLILGTNGDNFLRGGDGRDTIYGRPGYDTCRGEVVRGCEAVAPPASPMV